MALSVTEASHGNAIGVGLADLISQRLRDDIDGDAMSINAITSGFLERGKIPITLPTDREAIATALSRLPPEARRRPRVARILDTLHVSDFDVSEALAGELGQRPGLSIASTGSPLTFNQPGRSPMRFDDEHPTATAPTKELAAPARAPGARPFANPRKSNWLRSRSGGEDPCPTKPPKHPRVSCSTAYV